jgi:ribosomal protein L29
MAKKPETKKAVKATKTAKSLAVADMRTKSPDELRDLLKSAQADLLEFKKLQAASELTNPKVLKKTRREIAQLNTILTAVIKAHKEENDG